MGIYVIKMLDIGEGIVEVELVVWYVEVGQMIKEDQLFVDVMIDKVVVEILLLVMGKVIELGGWIGEMMVVGSELIWLEVEGDGNLKVGVLVWEIKVEIVLVVVVVLLKLVIDVLVELFVQLVVFCVLVKLCCEELVVQLCVVLVLGEWLFVLLVVCQCVWDMGIELCYVCGIGEVGWILYVDFDVYVCIGGGLVYGV